MSNLTPDDLADHMDQIDTIDKLIEDMDLFEQFPLSAIASAMTKFAVIACKLGSIDIDVFLKICETKFKECKVFKIEADDDG